MTWLYGPSNLVTGAGLGAGVGVWALGLLSSTLMLAISEEICAMESVLVCAGVGRRSTGGGGSRDSGLTVAPQDRQTCPWL